MRISKLSKSCFWIVKEFWRVKCSILTNFERPKFEFLTIWKCGSNFSLDDCHMESCLNVDFDKFWRVRMVKLSILPNFERMHFQFCQKLHLHNCPTLIFEKHFLDFINFACKFRYLWRLKQCAKFYRSLRNWYWN